MGIASKLLLGLLILLAGTLASSAQSAGAEGGAAAGEPIADFVRPADVAQLTLSPDGRYLAAVVPVPNKPHENYLAVLDGKTGTPLRGLHSGTNALVAGYFWNNDDRLIATLAVRFNGLDSPQLTGELFAIDPDGTHAMALFGYRAGGLHDGDGVGSLTARTRRRFAAAEPISMAPAGDDNILIAVNDFTDASAGTFTRIERLNVRTGNSVLLGQSPVRNADLVADHAGQVRVAYANNDFTGTKLWTRIDNDAPWVLTNDPATSGVEILPIGFNRDSSKLYVRASQDDRPDAIELMDLASGQRTLVYQGRFADPGPLLASADHQDYYAIITNDGREDLHYIDPDSDEARLNQALAQSFPGQLAYFSSFSRDGQHAIVRVVSDRNPGDYLLFDRDSRTARFLMHAAPWIHPRLMRPKEPIEITARDGLLLHGFLTTPDRGKPYPLVVLPHGGPHGVADSWEFDPEVQLLASRGYAVLQVNYRGSGGYGHHFQALGFRQWGLQMQDDLTDATRWAITQGYADSHRVCIYGASYGGYAALEGAVREPDLYRCAAGYAGVYDLRVQRDKSDTQRSDAGVAYLDTVLGTDREDMLRRSPLSGVARIQADLLLIHGKEDPRAPFKNFQEFTRALDQRGKHYDMLVEPDEGHGFFMPAHREAAYQKLLDFLARNIGTETQATGDTTASSRPVPATP